MHLSDVSTAYRLYNQGLDAEKKRLPIYAADDSFPPKFALQMFRAAKSIYRKSSALCANRRCETDLRIVEGTYRLQNGSLLLSRLPESSLAQTQGDLQSKA